MDIRFLLRAVLFILLVNFNAQADNQLGRLVKEQKNNDSTAYKESRVERKDVFSQTGNKPGVEREFPHEKPCYKIDRLIVENDFLNNRGIRKIQTEVAGKCLGVKGIEKVGVIVQDFFIRSGYVTTRIDMPSQDLLSRQLRLTVIPGRIAEVIITDDDIIKSLLPFHQGDILNIRDIEQGLENIQRTPGVNVKINIIPGDVNGTSKIEINPQREKKWNVRTSYNNFGDQITGNQLIGMTGYVYNLTKMSDLFYMAGTSSQTGGYKNFSTYYSFPIGYSEFSLFYSSSKSVQTVDIGPYAFDYVGKAEYLNLKGFRVLHRDMNAKLSASAELIKRKYDYTLGGTELVLQKRDMDNIRLGVNYKHNFTGATLDTNLTWQRFITLLGGSKTPDMRSGDVSSRSQIMNLNMNYVKWLNSLPLRAYYDLNLGVQYSPDNLTLQDKFSLGNRWSVRGFENSDGIDGNKGGYIQNTLNVMTGLDNAIAYIGADYGQISGGGSSQNVGGKNIMGSVVGLKGGVKALEYDISLSAPLIYPSKLDVDKYVLSFNLAYQL